MAKLMRYLTLPAPKRRRTEQNNKNGRGVKRIDTPSSFTSDTEKESSEPLYVDGLCFTRERRITRDSMRMVLLAENEYRVLFDSSSIIPTSQGDVMGAKKSPDGRYQFLRHGRDTNELGQMLFGTMAAADGAGSVKIHSLGDNRLLISRVFTMSIGNRKMRSEPSESTVSSCESESDCGCVLTVHSLDGLSHYLKKAAASCVPPEKFTPLGRHRRSRQSSLQTTHSAVDDEMIRGQTEWDDLRALSPPHRVFSRTRRNEALPRLSLQDEGYTMASMRARFSSMSSDNEMRTVGLGIILDAQERHFILQHMPLIEGELRRLESRIQLASANTATFIHNMYEGWLSFSSCVCILHDTPRLRNPVWLHLLKKPRDLPFTNSFCTLLAELTAVCDTKHSKFFLSNVVSAILMHHMSWIASVAPPPMHNSINHISITSDCDFSHMVGSSTSSSSSSLHGVNAHLAQLLEISGCVGGASRSARTVICGSDPQMVSKLLHVLSYFIRCTSIEHKHDAMTPSDDDNVDDFHANDPDKMLSDSSESSRDNPSMSCEESRLRGGMDCIPGPSTSTRSNIDYECGLGESLLAGPSYSYSPHFVLSGLLKNNDARYNYLVKISDEMSSYADSTVASARQELFPTCPTPENVTIVADCSDWTVKVMVGDAISELHSPAESVVSMLEQFRELYTVGCAPHLLTDVMEDGLADILAKSISLVEIVEGGPSIHHDRILSSDRVTSLIGCDHSDLRLLLNVASVYCPEILTTVIESSSHHDHIRHHNHINHMNDI